MVKLVTVLVENHDTQTVNMYSSMGILCVNSVAEADFISFDGGADVDPSMYGEKNTDSHTDMVTDYKSLILYVNALRLKKPMVGICRGGQFLNVMAGGKMVQHVSGHNYGSHEALMSDGRKVVVTSVHHQAMIPPKDSKELMVAHDGVPEAVLHKNGHLSFQPHPEYNNVADTKKIFFEMLKEHLGINT